MRTPFSVIPEKFFSPLASANREHYCSAILIFYEKFLSSPIGVDRDSLVDALEKYCENVSEIASEDDDISAETETGARGTARRLLLKIMDAGWVSEELLPDFTRRINIASFAKPFYEALQFVAQGGGVEYESHIVAVYSLLCSDASVDNGHYTILRAHEHTMKLLDSLKVLSQNIKQHFEMLHSASNEIKDILRAHYDLYMEDIIDRAYTRLKTSDNLSRYRPLIIRKINEFLENREWMESTAPKLAAIQNVPQGLTPYQYLSRTLEEIRESLRVIDPVVDDIDKRNRQYSRISTEKIKNRLYSDSTMSGKLISIVSALHAEEADCSLLEHNVFRFRSVSSESCFNRWKGDFVETPPAIAVPFRKDDIDAMEKELRRKISLQLNAEKIARYLDARIGGKDSEDADNIVANIGDFVKIMYAAVYSSASGKKFPFGVSWNKDEKTAVERFTFQSHTFFRKESTEKKP
jgi:hypothetical protein